MYRWIRNTIAGIAAASAAYSCSGDAAGDIRNGVYRAVSEDACGLKTVSFMESDTTWSEDGSGHTINMRVFNDAGQDGSLDMHAFLQAEIIHGREHEHPLVMFRITEDPEYPYQAVESINERTGKTNGIVHIVYRGSIDARLLQKEFDLVKERYNK